MYSLQGLVQKTKQWAEDRNLIQGSDAKSQCLKLQSEVGELSDGILKNRPHEIKDGIGDCLVVLIILAAQNNLQIKDCLEAAYNEIKHRRGKMVNRTFIKEGDQ